MSKIEEVVQELRQTALEADCASGYFTAVYSRETAAIAAAASAGAFEDRERMERLVLAFASHYLRVARGDAPRPKCWQAAWDVSDDPHLLIVQQLLLGVNPHVNYDMPQALNEVAVEVGGLGNLEGDFDRVGDTFADAYHAVMKDLDRVSRWVSEAGFLGGGRLFRFSLQKARERAWEAAHNLSELDAAGRAAYLVQLDELVSVLSYMLTRPPIPVNLLTILARRLEKSDPREVTVALLHEMCDVPGRSLTPPE
jgi:Family of unknown function (DUF5995)